MNSVELQKKERFLTHFLFLECGAFTLHLIELRKIPVPNAVEEFLQIRNLEGKSQALTSGNSGHSSSSMTSSSLLGISPLNSEIVNQIASLQASGVNMSTLMGVLNSFKGGIEGGGVSNPTSSYGPPSLSTVSNSNSTYGPPLIPTTSYGPPTSQSYTPNSNNYGPPIQSFQTTGLYGGPSSLPLPQYSHGELLTPSLSINPSNFYQSNYDSNSNSHSHSHLYGQSPSTPYSNNSYHPQPSSSQPSSSSSISSYQSSVPLLPTSQSMMTSISASFGLRNGLESNSSFNNLSNYNPLNPSLPAQKAQSAEELLAKLQQYSQNKW